jgi:YD repeat-containing protein
MVRVGDIALVDKSGTAYVPVSDQPGTIWNLLDSTAAKANSYTYDAFGRLAKHRWKDSGNTLLAGWSHAYDRVGDKKYSEDLVLTTTDDELYGYDAVYRLDSFKRGQLNQNKPPALRSGAMEAAKEGTTARTPFGPVQRFTHRLADWFQPRTRGRRHYVQVAESFCQVTACRARKERPTYRRPTLIADRSTRVFACDFAAGRLGRLPSMRHRRQGYGTCFAGLFSRE